MIVNNYVSVKLHVNNKDSVAVCESLFMYTKLKPHSSVLWGQTWYGLDVRYVLL